MTSSSRRKLYVTTLLSGAASILSYVIVFTHQDWVTSNCARGGWYAVLPIIMAFYFAFVHGTFTSCFLQLLGIRAAAGATAPKKPAESASQGEVRS